MQPEKTLRLTYLITLSASTNENESTATWAILVQYSLNNGQWGPNEMVRNIRAGTFGQKQWDGLLLNLIGIAMCQTEEAYFSVTGREGVRYEA